MSQLPPTDPTVVKYVNAVTQWGSHLPGNDLDAAKFISFTKHLQFPVTSATAQAQRPLLLRAAQLQNSRAYCVFQVFITALSIALIALVYTGQIPFKPYMIGTLSFFGLSLFFSIYQLKKMASEAAKGIEEFEKKNFEAMTPDAFAQKFGANYRFDIKPYVESANIHLTPALFELSKKTNLNALKAIGGSGMKLGQIFTIVIIALSALLLVLTYTGHIPLKSYMIYTVTSLSVALLSQTCCRPCTTHMVNMPLVANQMLIDGNN